MKLRTDLVNSILDAEWRRFIRVETDVYYMKKWDDQKTIAKYYIWIKTSSFRFNSRIDLKFLSLSPVIKLITPYIAVTDRNLNQIGETINKPKECLEHPSNIMHDNITEINNIKSR